MKCTAMLRLILIAAAIILASAAVDARIKLVSLPQRTDVIIRLENNRATLVEEERVLTLQKGLNQVDFSWNGVSIDPDSIRLALLSHPDRVKLLNVSYPPSEAALVWEIFSDEAWEETVRVSYLLMGIDNLIAYKALADRPEARIDLRGRLILRNFSGEDFEKARVFLNFGQSFEQQIIHEQTRQLLLFDVPGLPVEKIWTFDSRIQPWDPEKLETNVGIPVSYRIKNSSENGLGKFGLPAGKVRVFQDDGHGGNLFLGEDNLAFTAIGEKAEVRIGDSRDIVVTQRKMYEKKINVRRNKDNQVVLFDTDEKIKTAISNFKESPAVLTLIQHIPGQWDMVECNMTYRLKDATTLEFEVRLAPGEKKELGMHYQRRNIR